jgi:hypothetical protein
LLEKLLFLLAKHTGWKRSPLLGMSRSSKNEKNEPDLARKLLLIGNKLNRNFVPVLHEDRPPSLRARRLSKWLRFLSKPERWIGQLLFGTLLSDIDSLKVNAGIHRRVFGFNRLLSEKFPYAIYYAVESKTVYVRAVLDCRRAHEKLKSRLR